jgi:hypothetical protein
VAAVVVVFERVPPPLTVHVTPAAFLSFATAAVSETASVASTVVGDAVTATLADDVTATLAELMLPPPHPDRSSPAMSNEQVSPKIFRDIPSSSVD